MLLKKREYLNGFFYIFYQVQLNTLISFINVEVGINLKGGIFLKKLVHNSNKRGVEGGKI